MTLDELAAFVAVLQEGSVSRGAVALNRSQPALSRRLEQLEAELGCLLLDRSPAAGVLGPTEAGRALLPYAEAALAAARDARRAVKAVHSGGHGEVGLALVGTLATAAMSNALRGFTEACPAARLTLRTARSREISTLVRSGAVTLGLRYGAETDPALLGIPLGEERLLALAGKGLAARLSPRAGREKLRGLPWIGFPLLEDGDGSFGGVLRRQLLAAGLDDAPFTPVDSLTVQLRLMEADLGLGLLPTVVADEAVARGTLVRVPGAAPLEASVPVVLIHRRGAYLSAAARTLADSIAGRRGVIA